MSGVSGKAELHRHTPFAQGMAFLLSRAVRSAGPSVLKSAPSARCRLRSFPPGHRAFGAEHQAGRVHLLQWWWTSNLFFLARAQYEGMNLGVPLKEKPQDMVYWGSFHFSFPAYRTLASFPWRFSSLSLPLTLVRFMLKSRTPRRIRDSELQDTGLGRASKWADQTWPVLLWVSA